MFMGLWLSLDVVTELSEVVTVLRIQSVQSVDVVMLGQNMT
jgi:hypothetical protein